jgi:hypothetical protein
MDQGDEGHGLSPRRVIGLAAYIVGWCWSFVLASSGVGGHRYQLALRHKLLLTVISVLLPLLIARFGADGGSDAPPHLVFFVAAES